LGTRTAPGRTVRSLDGKAQTRHAAASGPEPGRAAPRAGDSCGLAVRPPGGKAGYPRARRSARGGKCGRRCRQSRVVPADRAHRDRRGIQSFTGQAVQRPQPVCSIGSGALQPLFEGGRLRNSYKSAKVQRDAAELAYAEAIQHALGDAGESQRWLASYPRPLEREPPLIRKGRFRRWSDPTLGGYLENVVAKEWKVHMSCEQQVRDDLR
jgi:hypothetical protein